MLKNIPQQTSVLVRDALMEYFASFRSMGKILQLILKTEL
jgi:hypothetical protein